MVATDQEMVRVEVFFKVREKSGKYISGYCDLNDVSP